MIDPDGFFIKLFPTVWSHTLRDMDEGQIAIEIGLPLEDVRAMNSHELHGRLAAVFTLRSMEAALYQVKKIREDRDRDFQRNHR